MAKKKIPGLFKRNGLWHIDKVIDGRRICQSTGTAELAEAEKFLIRILEQHRNATVYGVRPVRTFEQAAAKYVLDNQHKRSLKSDISRLTLLIPWIGREQIDKIHQESLVPWIENRRSEKVSNGTINHGLKVVRRILNLAATEWVDEYNLTWIPSAPKIRLLPDKDKKPPHPLSWDEQEKLFENLPKHLHEMALFAVNTGCRDKEICNLQWEWEVEVPELNTFIFIIPGAFVKNSDDRLVVLNKNAVEVVNRLRGVHPQYVFTYRGRPINRMLNNGWKKARNAVGLNDVRVHDLKHTFGRRLRAANVSFEDRQDLLGHRSGRITTHYSAAEVSKLIQAANLACDRPKETSLRVVQRRSAGF